MTLPWKDRFQIKPGRWVYIPTPETLVEGEKIKNLIVDKFTHPYFYFHLCNGGHVAAIRSHMHDHYFLHFDIADFFGSINRSRVTRSLKRRFPYIKARDITFQSTVRKNSSEGYAYHLPYGYPQSTVLASMCLHDNALGKYIETLSQTHTVSVYVDDIIISGQEKTKLEKISEKIIEKSERSNLIFGEKKNHEVSEKITAFNINLSHNYVEITDPRYNQLLRDALLTENPYVIEGIANYIKSINLKQYKKLQRELALALPFPSKF